MEPTMMDMDNKPAVARGSPIVVPNMGGNFHIKSQHLSIIKENTFDGTIKRDPYKHVTEFVAHCSLFDYGTDTVEGVRLRLFPLSLTGEAQDWLDEVEPGTFTSWEDLRAGFVVRFFSYFFGKQVSYEN